MPSDSKDGSINKDEKSSEVKEMIDDKSEERYVYNRKYRDIITWTTLNSIAISLMISITIIIIALI